MINHTFLDTKRQSNFPRPPRLFSRRLGHLKLRYKHKEINQESAHGTIARAARRKITSTEEARMAIAQSSSHVGAVDSDQEEEMAMMTIAGSSSRDHNRICL